MPTVLITGANRGIGLEFARQFAERGWRVHAGARDPDGAADLNALAGDVTVHRLDVSDGEQVAALAQALAGEPIDVLVNNAGMTGIRGAGLGSMDYGVWERVFQVNSMGPVRVLEALLDNLKAGDRKLVVNLTSRMGSIGDSAGGSYTYRSSKAALNAVMRAIALDLQGEGVTIVVVHPGWVQTDMGGRGAPVPVAESVGGLMALIDRLEPSDTGQFFNYDGSGIPW